MTLTEVSYYSRRMAPISLVFFFIFIVFYFMLQILFSSLNSSNSTAVVLNPIFGKIKSPYIKVASVSSQFTYTLDTVEGQPIKATEAAKVFFLPPTNAKFGYTEKIYLMAKSFGFDTEVIKHTLVDTEASFTTDLQTLSIDVTNFNYTYQYNFKPDDPSFINARIPPETEIVNKATDYLRSIGTYPDELAQGKSNIVYLKYGQDTNSITVVQRPQDANMVEVDFYRPNIDDIPVVSPKFFNSQNYVVMTFNDLGDKVMRAQVRFYDKSDTQVGLYPVKSGDDAWAQLKAGKGVIVNSPPGINSISIKRMFVAYFDPDIYQQYLQPVYVFLGENNFVAYVTAINDQYLTE